MEYVTEKCVSFSKEILSKGGIGCEFFVTNFCLPQSLEILLSSATIDSKRKVGNMDIFFW